jgi:hypothetical protein
MAEVDDRFGAAVAAYEIWLARQPLAVSTKREYKRWVCAFAAWAAAAPQREEWGGDPLVDQLARDYAARDFKRWLQVESEGLSIFAVPAALTGAPDCPSIPGPSVHLRSIPTYA